MDNVYEILDLLYQFNKKYPELRIGQLISVLTTSQEDIFYLSNEEIKFRLEELLKEE
jgi:hypothetical protein